MAKVKFPKSKKKNFSSFSVSEAYKQLGIITLIPWKFESQPLPISDFFKKRLERLQKCFDLRSYEESKKLLIDAFCEEAMEDLDQLKIWKGGKLESDVLIGNADYLIAEKKDYLETPFICIIEAKKDDFEQGLAQCLVEMQACQWQNKQAGKPIDILGIVTNAREWMFYKLDLSGKVYESNRDFVFVWLSTSDAIQKKGSQYCQPFFAQRLNNFGEYAAAGKLLFFRGKVRRFVY